jgi:Flp pilus assembly pilin Flp
MRLTNRPRQLAASIFAWIQARRDDEGGASLVEYGLLVTLIAIVVVFAIGYLGRETTSLFEEAGSGF